MAAHEYMHGDNTPNDKRSDDVRFIKIEHLVDKLSIRVESLHENHTEHKKELSELSTAVTRLANTINRAIWVIIGGAAVIAFLASGQLTQTVKVGQAIVESQNASR